MTQISHTMLSTLKLSLLSGACVFMISPAMAQNDLGFPPQDEFVGEFVDDGAAAQFDEGLEPVVPLIDPNPQSMGQQPFTPEMPEANQPMDTFEAVDAVNDPAFVDVAPSGPVEQPISMSPPLEPFEPLPIAEPQPEPEPEPVAPPAIPSPEAAARAAQAPAVAAPAAVSAAQGRFYDSSQLIPQSELARGGPRNMDPAMDPASSLVTVKKDGARTVAGANTVAAERAMTLGLYDSAVGLYEMLYVKNKRDPQVLMGYAIALQKVERKEEAIDIYKELIDLRPNNVEAEVNMLGLMAEIYPQVALNRLKTLEDKHGDNAALLAQMAVTYARIENFDLALRYYGMVSAKHPHNANHVYNMAVIADHKGDRDMARDLYERALELDVLHHGAGSLPRNMIFERLAMIR